MGQCIFGQLLEQDAGLNGYGEIFQIIGEDPVHLGGADDHTSADRRTAAHQAGSGSPGGDRDTVFITDFKDARHLLGGENVDGDFRHLDTVDGHFIPGIVRVDAAASDDPTGDDFGKLVNNCRGYWIVICHVCAYLLLY